MLSMLHVLSAARTMPLDVHIFIWDESQRDSHCSERKVQPVGSPVGDVLSCSRLPCMKYSYRRAYHSNVYQIYNPCISRLVGSRPRESS